MQAALDLVGYLLGTKDLCVRYTRSTNGNFPEIYERGAKVQQNANERTRTIEERLQASLPNDSDSNEPNFFIDADYAGDTVTRRSTSGLLVTMNGGPINWSSRLQKLCAQSSAESEIYAVTESVKEAIHIKLLCEEIGIRQPGVPMTIWEDNNACIQMGHGIRGAKGAKHYEVRLRFLHEHIVANNVEFARINTKDQQADGFTKALPFPAFIIFRDLVLHKPRDQL